MSLPRSQKIPQHQSYGSAMKGGSVKRLDGFKIYTAPQDKLQVGVVIPKKMINLSSDRQRLRRQIHGITQQLDLAGMMLIVQVTKKWKDPVELTPLKEALATFAKTPSTTEDLSFQP